MTINTNNTTAACSGSDELAVANAIVHIRALFEVAPWMATENYVPSCGLVTFADLKAIQEYADTQFESATPPAGGPVEDTYLVGGPDLRAMSGSVESDRVIQLHFRRKATDEDRKWLLDAINGKIASDHDSATTQASAPRSASAGDGQEDRLRDRKNRLENSFGGGDFHDGMARKAIAEIDAELAALSAPPPIRIDQGVGIREALEKIDALISNGDRPTVNEQNAFEHFGKLNRLLLSIRDIARAAISANTTAGVDVRESALRDIISWKEDTLGPRPKVQGPYDCAQEITEAFDRGARMAFYRCALRASEALSSNPLEGKGIQSKTEQASSGVRSPTSGEG